MSKKKKANEDETEIYDQVEVLIEALNFYADQSDHRKAKQIVLDGGEVARKALKAFNDAE